ncbi:MAG: ATP synthase F1 subunit gamma [Candidatus Cellulosilyticum pullistercoris]|uniref:ATP synthase gamma chain n=1 Tax=Candidatus Cellulosilyticum pullistercoris TaxID=2838521 RepID=A0A9E2KCW2_9FIRM|nr:ATP synthase F1 subunit gamma [Candidatus Cellulosilyticum pullistercoris]
MTNMREIRSRMKSIQDIMKITNAMYLISSSKLKKARKSLTATEPYFETLQTTIQDILMRIPDIEHSAFDMRTDVKEEDKKRGYIVITADKGLAGAYNHNIIKLAEKEMNKGKNNFLFAVGQVGRRYFAKKNVTVDVEFLYTAQNPTLHRARIIAATIIELYERKELDEVYIIYTKMITPMKAEAEMLQVLPLQKSRFDKVSGKRFNETAVFNPSPEKVMDKVVPNYIKGLIYGTLVEAFSSEQNARMMAMEAATTSAKEMISDLSLMYNRARQAAITQEITEIASGAKCAKK